MEPITLTEFAFLLAAYLVGSISTAILACRAMGLPDPRTQGSGNPGATNVLRVGGKKAAGITLAGDMIKGLLPVLAGLAMAFPLNTLILIGFAAFLGHLYPVFFGFRGGKGVATAIGVLIGAHWPVGLATVLTWLVVAKVFRISSLSALTAFLLTPVYSWFLAPGEYFFVGVVTLMCVMLFWRHRSNIRKLMAGTED